MNPVDDDQPAEAVRDVYGSGEVGAHRPRPLLRMVLWPFAYLIRCQNEPLAILSPEGKVEQPSEWADGDVFNGKVEGEQTVELPREVEENSAEGARDVAVGDTGIER
jgi:hypothetical protein